MTRDEDKITMALIDDHAMFRAGLVSLFGQYEHIDVLFETGNPHEFLNLLQEQQPEIILVDLKMPAMSGQHVIELVKEKYPDMKIIVLSSFDDESVILNCLKELRVNSYLLKSASPRELYQAIVKVHDEGFHFTPHISEIMFHGLRKRKLQSGEGVGMLSISEREKEVLHLICQGDTNGEIAEKLFISKRTVEGHRKHLLEKTHCKNSASLVAFAFQQRLVSI
jgi:DNA-binding NarL/FixJ family response regulator